MAAHSPSSPTAGSAMIETRTANPIILFRSKDRPAWTFTWDDRMNTYVFRGRVHVYTIEQSSLRDRYLNKIFWIGRVIKHAKAVVTIEKEIGALYLLFPCGAIYTFPQ